MYIVKPALSDKFLINEILKIKELYNIKVFIETGTHLGGSALIASNFFDKVITCENHEYYYNLSKNAIENSNQKNIELHFCSSIDLLNKLVPYNELFIIFLDAHTPGSDYPLLGELELLAKNDIKPIILIHDFYVPDENGNAKFGYDSILGRKLDLNYIWEKLIKIYGNDEKFKYYYLPEQELDSGVIYIMPN